MNPAFDTRLFIAQSPWFAMMPEELLDRLADCASLKHFDEGSHIWRIGETTSALYGLVRGRIRVYLASEGGQEYALVDWENGAWFGEQTLAVDEPNMLGVQVMEPSELLVVPASSVREIAKGCPTFYEALFKHGWRNTRGLYEIVSSLAFYPLRARLAGRVLQLIDEHGERTDRGFLLNITLSQNDFARLSMGSRQRVNAIMREWSRAEILEYRGDNLLIREPSALLKEIKPFE